MLGTLAGFAFATLRLWRGRLGDAVLAHAVCNAGLAAAALGGGRLDSWS
jgi:membrane protease YdiL (CAAX protease family)